MSASTSNGSSEKTEPFPELWEPAALERYASLFDSGLFALPRTAAVAEPQLEPVADSLPGALPDPPPDSPPDVPLVTETLGQLLEDQGHVDEAAEVYGNVLASRPTDRELRQRALEAARKQEWPLVTEDLLPSAEQATMEPAVARRELLGRYLTRLDKGRGQA